MTEPSVNGRGKKGKRDEESDSEWYETNSAVACRKRREDQKQQSEAKKDRKMGK